MSFSQREQVLKVVLKKTHSKSNDTIIGFFFSKLKLFKKCRSLQNISYNVKNAEIELLELTYQEQNILVYSYHLCRKLEHCKQEEEATLPPLFLTSNNTGKTTSLSCKKIDELAL